MNSVRYRDANVIAMLADDHDDMVANSSLESALIAQDSGTATGNTAKASEITE
ncbi:hypothetical protein NO386_25870 [Escherichia coli]|nr:hypothetical protein [Escherichia coli]